MHERSSGGSRVCVTKQADEKGTSMGCSLSLSACKDVISVQLHVTGIRMPKSFDDWEVKAIGVFHFSRFSFHFSTFWFNFSTFGSTFGSTFPLSGSTFPPFGSTFPWFELSLPIFMFHLTNLGSGFALLCSTFLLSVSRSNGRSVHCNSETAFMQEIFWNCCLEYTIFSTYIYIIDIYIYICLWSYYLGHVWGFLIVTNWATFVFLKRLFSRKHYKNRGFSRFFVQNQRGPKILIVTNWATLPIFKACTNVAQLVTIKVAQLVTIKNCHFFNFLLLKMCWNTYFYSVFEHATKNCQKMAQKTITFDIFQNTGLIKKKPFCCNPPFDQKMFFFVSCLFGNQKPWCWTKSIEL